MYCCKSPRTNKFEECGASDYSIITDDAKRKVARSGNCSQFNSGTGGTGTGGTGTGSGVSYSVCSGPTYSNGCKDSGAPNPNGPIYKVQGCIGASQDSKFGPKTEKALKVKTGKTTFKESDVENICKGVSVDDQSPNNQGGKIMTPEKQKEFFDKLIDTGRINDGYIQELKPNSDLAAKDGSIYRYCYIKKFESTRNEQGKITAIGNGTPISGKADVVYSQENLFVILFPDFLYGYMEKRGEIITNPSYTWSPGDASASNVFLESKRRRKLSEQKIEFGPIIGSNWNFNTTGTVGGTQGTTGTQGSTQTQTTTGRKYEIDYEKLCAYVNPRRDKAVQILEEMRDMEINLGLVKIPLVDKDGKKQLQQSIDELKKVDCKTVCDSENLKILADGKAMILDKQKNDKNAKYVKEKLEKLLVLIDEIQNECKRIDKERKNTESQNTSNQNTTSNQGTGNQSSGNQNATTVVTGSRKEDLRKLFGFVDEDGNTMSPKSTISSMNKTPEKGFVRGMGSLQYAIDNYEARSEWFEDYNELMDAEGLSQFKLKFPADFEDEEYAGLIIDKENYSALTPIKSDANSQFKRSTFGKFFGNKSDLPIFQIQSGTGEFGVEKTKCAGNPREKLINYLTAAFSASRSFRGSNELDYFERCLATKKLQNAFKDEGPLKRSDFEEVDTDRLPFGAFNNKLGLKEIIRLLRGEEVNGAEITNNDLIDKDFYRQNFAVYESVKNTVKKNLNEAIAKKKNLKLTESALTKILTNIKRKGY